MDFGTLSTLRTGRNRAAGLPGLSCKRGYSLHALSLPQLGSSMLLSGSHAGDQEERPTEGERKEAHTVPTVSALGAALFPCATHVREGASRHPQPQMPSD